MNDTKQVPLCPTLEMVKAGLDAYYARGAGKTQEAMRKAYVAMLAAAPASGECEWRHDQQDDAWASKCGEYWQFNDGGPAENRVKFCHGCGKPVRIKP